MNYTHLKTPKEILNAALDMEKMAHDFYADLGRHCHVDYIRDLLLRLQNEEARHLSLIQKMQSELRAGRSPQSPFP